MDYILTKKIRITLIVLLTLVGGMTSCVEDETIHDFEELNEVEIQLLDSEDDVIEKLLYDRLQITPDISTSFNDDSDLEYNWILRSSSKSDVISEERDLDIEISPEVFPVDQDGLFLALKVIDKSTGVFYFDEVKIFVNTIFSKGRLILGLKDGESTVSFLTFEDELFEDVYKRANGGNPVGVNPLQIDNYGNSYSGRKIVILCGDEQGGVFVDEKTFVTKYTTRESFITQPKATILDPYLIEGGDLSFATMRLGGNAYPVGSNFGPWKYKLICTEANSDYNIAPIILEGAMGGSMFYDEKYGRILYRDGMMASGNLTEIIVSSGFAFDPSGFGENTKLLTAGNNNGTKWFLVKNLDTEEIYLYECVVDFDWSFFSMSFEARSKTLVTEAMAEGISEASLFTSPKKSNYLIYERNKQIRFYSIDNKTSGVFTGGDLSAENIEISNIKCVTHGNYGSETSFFVSTINNELTSLKGGYREYDISTVGGFNLVEKDKQEGFCDELIDIAIRD
ncbi:PKD-like family lipoprotein [Marinifilum sp. RC60d5]|uniref:PKD-like family lipoprotein n=1 Tax=Marinifilum sp. RC60d5 TaxID=3458414 RepID=UPI004036DFCB